MFAGSKRFPNGLTHYFTICTKPNSYNLRSFKKIAVDSDRGISDAKSIRFTGRRLGHTQLQPVGESQSVESPRIQHRPNTQFYPYPYPYPYPWENSLDIYYYHLMSTQSAAPTAETGEIPAPSGKLIKADSIAAKFRSDIEQTIRERTSSAGRKPKLVGILATDSKPSESYAEFTQKTCDSIGVDFVLKRVGGALVTKEGDQEIRGVNGEGVEEAIIEANEDSNIDGIMVYYPIFGGLQDHYLQQVVSPFKDVEGLHSKFHFHLYHNVRFIRPKTLLSSSPFGSISPSSVAAANTKSIQQDDTPPPGTVKSIIPCTPLAIVKCLEYLGVYNTILSYGDRAYGKTITVINRSEVVGRPLAALLANDGARVFSVDIDSIQEYTKRPTSNTNAGPRRLYHPRHVVHPCSNTLEECLALSDVVISAVPSVNYKVKTANLKDGCVCVNISSEKNFEKEVRDKASLYLPSVGKVTIMMLLRNLMRLCQYQDILREENSQASVASV
ncbi:hypothetical protein FRC02_001479 [Tulasnella sp. 418]|nr:hypothetical protein FRC02_001479 [Tulasnella sp. 418]